MFNVFMPCLHVQAIFSGIFETILFLKNCHHLHHGLVLPPELLQAFDPWGG
jgi:hypothetical protein